jgi:hypothetical protein
VSAQRDEKLRTIKGRNTLAGERRKQAPRTEVERGAEKAGRLKPIRERADVVGGALVKYGRKPKAKGDPAATATACAVYIRRNGKARSSCLLLV